METIRMKIILSETESMIIPVHITLLDAEMLLDAETPMIQIKLLKSIKIQIMFSELIMIRIMLPKSIIILELMLSNTEV